MAARAVRNGLRMPTDRACKRKFKPNKLFTNQVGRSGAWYGSSYDEILAQNKTALGVELFDTLAPAGSNVANLGGGRFRITATATGTAGAWKLAARGSEFAFGSLNVVSNPSGVVVSAYARGAAFSGQNTTNIGTRVAAAQSSNTTEVISIFFTATAIGQYIEVEAISVKAVADWSKLVLFDDLSGTVPVFSALQSNRGRGLLLDRSKGLVRGAELVANGEFVDATNWGVDPGWTISGGKAVFVQTGSGNRNVYGINGNGNFCVAGRWYEVQYTVVAGSGFRPTLGGMVGPTSGGPGVYRCILQATSTNGITINGALATDGSVDGVSVREFPGNHMVQPTAAARGEFSRRYNEWIGSDSALSAAWTRTGMVAVDVQMLREDASNGYHQFLQAYSLPAGAGVVFSAELKAAGRTRVGFGGNWMFNAVVVDLVSGAVTGASAASVVTTMLADGWVRCVFTGVVPDAVNRSYAVRLRNGADTDQYVGNGVSGVMARRIDVRLAADLAAGIPTYQRVTSASDYDEVGFPAYWRGVTDDFAFADIDPAGATKTMMLWAGQKMSDAVNYGTLIEASTAWATTNGTLILYGPGAASSDSFRFGSRGNGSAAQTSLANSPAPAPSRSVVRGMGDIANDVCQLYIGGSLAASSALDQGAGAFTAQRYYFGARAGTSLFVNIREYAPPLILFMQAADPGVSASEIYQLEKQYRKLMGV